MPEASIQQPGKAPKVANDARLVSACLVGVAVSLILAGVVSDTLARHLVQIAPVLFALALVLRRPAAGAWVAIPVLAVWGVVMIAIWAYLRGLSGLAEGSCSIVEVVLTIVIAAFAHGAYANAFTQVARFPCSTG